MSTGIVTSGVEVVQLSPFGLWLDVEGNEYFLSREDFPWFHEAPAKSVWKVELDSLGNLHWPELDVDLERASLADLKSYPLIYR